MPLINRLSMLRPSLVDRSSLTFREFVRDIDSYGNDKFGAYAENVLNRQQLSGRLKVEVCYEIALFFEARRLSTFEDIRHLDDKTASQLVFVDLQAAIHGIGPALAHYLLNLLGYEDHIKLGTMMLRFLRRSLGWSPNPYSTGDYNQALSVFEDAGGKLNTTPARLDNAIWAYERKRV